MKPRKRRRFSLSFLQNELIRLHIRCDAPTMIRKQNGVIVARVSDCDESCILKLFERPEFRREIDTYRLLASLGIPTIRVLAYTDCSLLLEDLSTSPRWRLAEADDMADCEIAERLAEWYACLHSRGRAYVRAHTDGLYDETDTLTRENLALARDKTDTQALPIWATLERQLDDLRARLDRAERTLTYNDFFYTNMTVARDRSAARMFDYNLLGKGLASSDLSNVTASLSREAGEAFLRAYDQPIDPAEQALNDVVSVLVGLIFACQRERFPDWGAACLAELEHGLDEKIARLCDCTE